MNVGLRRFLLWWRLDHDAFEVGNVEMSCACSSSAFFCFPGSKSRLCWIGVHAIKPFGLDSRHSGVVLMWCLVQKTCKSQESSRLRSDLNVFFYTI